MDLAAVAALLFYFPIAVGLAWFAGHVITTEEWWGDTRRRLEDRWYRDGPAVRAGHPSADDFWDRVRPWPVLAEPDIERRRKPARTVNRAATAARGKVIDAIGCPKCAGWWGSLILGLLCAAWAGPWDVSWGWFGVHAAGWGVARRIDWAD